jgi:hypothetical protein
MPSKKPTTRLQKVVKEATPRLPAVEETETIQAVQAELSAAYGGAFKVLPSVVTSKWDGDIPNRPFSQTAVDNLVQAMRDHGVLRLEPPHHAVGTMEQERLDWLFQNAMKITPDEVQNRNATGDYPEIDHIALEEHGFLIQLEGGQHRFKAIQSLKSKEENNQWWVLKLYRQPLSPDALMYLRNNEKVQHEKLSDGERLWQCHKRQIRMDSSVDSPEERARSNSLQLN